MTDSAQQKGPSVYRADVLHAPRIVENGVAHVSEGGEEVLGWEEVRYALVADVGEPEGVRAIVFDLVLAIEHSECHVVRLDAEPGSDAIGIAQSIEEAIGREHCTSALHSLATDGAILWWYPDLSSYEEAALEAVRFSGQ